jgi:simple sugar transport system permease protein
MSALASASIAARLRRPDLWLPVGAVVLALLGGLMLIAAAGVSLRDAVGAFADGAWGSPYSIGASLNRAVALGLVGLGFIVAHRANLTNVGGEGQIAVGGIASAAVCLFGGAATLPGPLAWIVPLLAAALVGGAWASIAGFLKVRIGTNEVITTLLLSFIAVWALYGCVQSTTLLRQPMTNSATLPESLEVPMPTHVPMLVPDLDMPLHVGALVLLALAAIVAVVLERSLFGVRLRAVGLSAPAARRAGMPIGATIVIAMFIAGAFAGLAGGFMLQGEQLALKARFPSGYGFDGLVVGLLARGAVKGVLGSALLFGFLRSGGINMELVAAVPSAIVLVIQGLVILLLAGSAWWLERRRVR